MTDLNRDLGPAGLVNERLTLSIVDRIDLALDPVRDVVFNHESKFWNQVHWLLGRRSGL